MALPMMSAPTYTMVVPSSGVSVKFRPFLVKEEKALLIAQQSEDIGVMIQTLKGIINTCVLDKLDVDKLATFDLEYMFTQIRAKSVGEIIELIFPCDIDHGEDNEKARVKVSIDLTTLIVEKDPNHNNKINLFGDVGVVMKYPTMDVMKRLENLDTNDLDKVFGVVADSIDYIYQGEEIFYGKEQKHEELLQFLNNLTSEQFVKVQQFFATMPRIKKEIEYTCPVCQRQHRKMLEGMQSFF
jgi:T4 bacteriophage base plate protein